MTGGSIFHKARLNREIMETIFRDMVCMYERQGQRESEQARQGQRRQGQETETERQGQSERNKR